MQVGLVGLEPAPFGNNSIAMTNCTAAVPQISCPSLKLNTITYNLTFFFLLVALARGVAQAHGLAGLTPGPALHSNQLPVVCADYQHTI